MTRDPDAANLAVVAVEDPHRALTQDRRHLLGLARFVVVVAQHRDDRHPRRGQVMGQELGLLRQAEVGQVAGHQQDVRPPARVLEQLPVPAA